MCAGVDAVMLCACGGVWGNCSALWVLLCIVWCCGGLGRIVFGVLVSCVMIILFVKSEM